ncbi:MAG: hypothetical protein Q7T48_17775 [Cellvibrio sp.]|uniref:hypothetical protein n=1 Tax=Cellvibrio sp. TaxID=1965322 RepID=UPI0027291BCD|nr:hypothetical protein [Cellvibrio sp.]
MKLTKFAFACALTSALAACGGGGDSSVDAPQVATTRTLDGVAAKGLIKNGVVKVYSYSADGVKSASPIATTRTLPDGSYSVSLGSNIGLFTVEVSADAATTMFDEFAGEIEMPVGMTLRSLLKLDSAASTAVKGYVTPFTDMLVNAAASATGGLTAANAAAAQTGVTAMLGFNPLATKPLMSNSDAGAAATDASEKLQSVTLAALSKLANDSSNSLGCSGTVSQKIQCVVTNTTGSAVLTGSTLSITSAVQDQLKSALDSVATNPVINKTTLTTFVGQTTFSQATVSATSSALGPIDAAKALFASLRTNINAWSAAADNGGALNLNAQAMKADFETAIAPLDQDLADWVLLSERGVRFYKDYVDAGNSGLSNQAVFRDGNEIGKCFLYADAADTTEVAIGVAANNVFCRLNKAPVAGTEASLAHTTSATPPVTTNLTRQQFTKAIQLTPVSSSTTSFSYTARARMETAYFNRVNGNVINLSIDDAKTTIGIAGTGTVAYTKNGNTVTDIAIVGDMPARTNSLGVKKTDKEIWNVSYVRTVETDGVTIKYALSGDIAAYKRNSADVLVKSGSIALQAGSFIRAVPVNGYVVSEGVKEVNLAIAVAGVDSKVVGTLSLSNFSLDGSSNNYAPTDLKFIGSFTNASSEFFNGTLAVKVTGYNANNYGSSLPDSMGNFVKREVSLAGSFKIPTRPALTLTVNGSNPSYGSESFNGQYDDGTNVVLFSATDKHAVNISTANGISLTLTEGSTTADVMKDNSKVATLDLSAGMINFADGSFQSLK